MLGFLFRGAAAGFAATIPMTAVILALHRLLPREREMELAPFEVAEGVAEVTGVEAAVPEEVLVPGEIVAHFGYGAAAGVLHQALTGTSIMARMAFGAIFGFAVWAASYLGYLPALRIRRPATRDPWQRNFTMIVAHLVWGATLGLLAARLRVTDED